MEFNEKLQELRKKNGLTQEELSEKLFVSRTAVSKWESGRGVPNIESLKAISKYFSVSIDDLLSGEELLTIADEDCKNRENNICDLVFGLLDCSMIILLFIPLFAQRGADVIKEVSLFALDISLYIKVAFFTILLLMVIMGVLTLALQNSGVPFWVKYKHKLSALLSVLAMVIFIATNQVYVALFALVFLLIKASLLLKHR